jgi:UPF0716 protein FxsA
MVGEEIGLFTTLFLSVVTAIIGASLLKQQGLKTLFSAQSELSNGTLPLKEIFDGFCFAIAGATLITPGFFTDLIGFLLLIPSFRGLLMKGLPKLFDMQSSTQSTSSHFKIDITDVEFERTEDDDGNSIEKE